MSTRLPRRSDQFAARTAFASASCRRAAIAEGAKPEKIGTCTAPTWAHALEAIAAAGLIGMKIPTRSPGSIPAATRASASLVTARET